MRKYFQFYPTEALYLIVIFLSWILLVTGKNGAFPYIGNLLLPSTFFWVGTGICLSVVFYKRVMRIQESLTTIKWKKFPMILSLLLAYQLYFFHQIPQEKQNNPYFFMWVPLLYWATSIIFYSDRKDLIRFRLIAIAALVAFLFIAEDSKVTIFASLCLVAAGLLAFNRKDSYKALFQGAALQTLLTGFFSFTYWREDYMKMIDVYAAFGTGFIIGISILLFLQSFSLLRIRISWIGISLCVLTDLTLSREGILVNIFCIPLIFLALITLRTALYIEKKAFKAGSL